MKQLTYKIAILIPSLCLAINPLAELTKPLPKQHIVISKHDVEQPVSHTNNNPQKNIQASYLPEEVIVFALQAAVASFHLTPETRSTYPETLSRYYDASLHQELKRTVIEDSKHAMCHISFLTLKSCSALPINAATLIDKDNKWSISIPMVLSDHSKFDIIYTITPTESEYPKYRIANYEIKQHDS
ncbi:hypothetical protein MMH89_01170 [Candidatus Comchoanobacter bicostacola]|uniref:Uncharacterized protein n=1 Tax=Candidatus Comchoanobacter bicostacola TaxID=2919598 RepID=A0ABY5DKF2_9GAMM|nr:hypothetical protein [Candidatus Comchoanobacter bicostacola]UTC24764.1 hypothetical protein MMH89_01170 [Candidatus Comchoanobacter bicostacola]